MDEHQRVFGSFTARRTHTTDACPTSSESAWGQHLRSGGSSTQENGNGTTHRTPSHSPRRAATTTARFVPTSALVAVLLGGRAPFQDLDTEFSSDPREIGQDVPVGRPGDS